MTAPGQGDDQAWWAALNAGTTGRAAAEARNLASFRVGLWYGTPAGTIVTTSPGVNELRVSPLYVPRARSLDRLRCEVTVAAAASVVRMCVYRDDGDGYPGELVLDGGTVDAATIGVKDLVVNQPLEPGVYWLGSVSQGGTPQVRAIIASSPLVGRNDGNMTVTHTGYLQAAAVAGAAPAQFAALADQSTIPRVLVRVAA